jgi:hypothetical protein
MVRAPDPAITPELRASIRATCGDDSRALCALAARLIVGRDTQQLPDAGAALLEEAATSGNPQAWALLAVIAAAGVGRQQSWSDALAALYRAAELGDAAAAHQRDLLAHLGIANAQDAARWIAAAQPLEIRHSPRLISYREFLAPALCAHFIERARPKLVPARVNDARGGGLRLDPMRTNTCAVFSLIETDFLTQLVRARMAAAAGVSVDALEPAEILHYEPGETYRLHVDFFHPQLPTFAQEMRTKGQRVKTCLVYLNDDLDGGETEFPKLGIKFRGGRGEALIFDNVGPNGAGDIRTLHTGLPPTRGEKWLLSQWIRSKRQPVV